MESKADYILRLKTELCEVSSQIEKLIMRTDQMGANIMPGYDELETALLTKQSSTEAKLTESLRSGDEMWDLVWNNVWDAVSGFNSKVTTEIKQDYDELEPALHAKQSALQSQIDKSIMSANEVWDEIWSEVGVVVEKLNCQAAAEIKLLVEELQALQAKQSALQEKLHDLLISGDKVWNVVKEVTDAMVDGPHKSKEFLT